MLFYKPETYLLPSPREIVKKSTEKIIDPTKGCYGDPAVPMIKQYIIQKRGPFHESKPRFIRDSISNHDIEGSRSKPLYLRRSGSKMLTNHDIEGSTPSRRKARDLTEYNILDYSDVIFKRKLRSSMRQNPPPPPNIRVKRPNGESFFLESNGDIMMRSSQSNRISDLLNASGNIDSMSIVNQSTFIAPKKRLDEVEDVIK